MSTRTAYLCDFDGTVSPMDVGARLMARFSTASRSERRRSRRSGVPARSGTARSPRRSVRTCAATPSEAIEFIRGFELDPDFARSCARPRRAATWCGGERGIRLLHRGCCWSAPGSADLPLSANRLRFEGGRACAGVSARRSRAAAAAATARAPHVRGLPRARLSHRDGRRRTLGSLRRARGGCRAGARRAAGMVPRGGPRGGGGASTSRPSRR